MSLSESKAGMFQRAEEFASEAIHADPGYYRVLRSMIVALLVGVNGQYR